MRRAAAAVLLAACASARAPAPPPDSDPGADAEAAGLRAAMSLAEDDFQRVQIREELARAELRRARAAHTVFAYRKFLDEFPVGDDADVARGMLEQLRFAQAGKTGTKLAWESFLDEHPRGRFAPEARRRLGALEIAAALATKDRARVRDVLARYPDHEARGPIVQHEDDLAYSEAKAAGLDGLGGYLADHPTGRHRAEAEGVRRLFERVRLLETENLALARKRASQGDATDDDRAVVAELTLRRALRSLDEAALAALAGDETAPAPMREMALQRVESLARVPPAPQIREAIDAARAGAGLRNPQELRALVGVADPLEQAEALRELAEQGRMEDADAIVAAMDSRYAGVRLAAVEALRALHSAVRPAVWDGWRAARETELLPAAMTAPPWRRLAAIRDAVGDAAGAAAAWREVVRFDPDDVTARARLLALEPADDRLARATAARDLAKAAAFFGAERWLRPPDPLLPAEERRDGPGETVGLAADLTVLRQLCTAIELAGTAGRALRELQGPAGAAEQEILGLALEENERAVGRLVARREELELQARRRDGGYRPCGTDRVTERVDASRRARTAALRRLGGSGDRRVREFVENQRWSASAAVREAADAAFAALEKAPPEPPAPVPAPAEPKRPTKKRGRRGAARPVFPRGPRIFSPSGVTSLPASHPPPALLRQAWPPASSRGRRLSSSPHRQQRLSARQPNAAGARSPSASRWPHCGP